MLLSRHVLLAEFVFLLIIAIVNGSPPEEPVRCSTNFTNCTLTDSNGSFRDCSTCHDAVEVVYPSSEEDHLVSIVANATQSFGNHFQYLFNVIMMLSRPVYIIEWVFVKILATANGNPPEEPVRCSKNFTNCTITNSYGAFPDRSTCHAAEVVYPSSEEDLVSIISKATQAKRQMRVASRYSHSIPKLVCPYGDDGLIISTENLNGFIEIDKDKMLVTLESGVTLRQLISEAAKNGLALPYSPYWWGLTIGGLLGTGAHGSTLWGDGSAIHDYVVRMRLVTPGRPEDGYAKVRTLEENDEFDGDMNAAKVSLGVLGVISQVTLRLQPMFKRSITFVTQNDTDLSDQAAIFGRQHEFADITWLPSQNRVVYRIDDPVSSNIPGNGQWDYPGFRATPSLVHHILRSTEEDQEAKGDVAGKCSGGKLFTNILIRTAYGLTNDGISFKGYPVVGYQDRLQASGSCLKDPKDAGITTCPWDPHIKGFFFHQTAISIVLSKAKYFIQDVQKLVKIAPQSLCGIDLYNGILMRYVTGSNAYLGKQEDSLDFDITYYRSKDPKSPRLFEDVLEEIEQMVVFKYGGLPHWGKNRNVAFEGVIKKYKKRKEFLKVKEKYDPLGLFSNEWTDQVLGLKDGVTIVKEGCALEGLCVCSEDIHCAPQKGYLCRPGKIFKDARVCTLIQESVKDEL